MRGSISIERWVVDGDKLLFLKSPPKHHGTSKNGVPFFLAYINS